MTEEQIEELRVILNNNTVWIVNFENIVKFVEEIKQEEYDRGYKNWYYPREALLNYLNIEWYITKWVYFKELMKIKGWISY